MWHAPAGIPPVGPRFFTVALRTMPAGTPEPTAAELRSRPGPQTGLINYAESAAENGRLAGRLFERVTMTCTASRTRLVVRGFQYTSSGKTCIAIMYEGAEADQESFKVAEAAARTLRKR